MYWWSRECQYVSIIHFWRVTWVCYHRHCKRCRSWWGLSYWCISVVERSLLNKTIADANSARWYRSSCWDWWISIPPQTEDMSIDLLLCWCIQCKPHSVSTIKEGLLYGCLVWSIYPTLQHWATWSKVSCFAWCTNNWVSPPPSPLWKYDRKTSNKKKLVTSQRVSLCVLIEAIHITNSVAT